MISSERFLRVLVGKIGARAVNGDGGLGAAGRADRAALGPGQGRSTFSRVKGTSFSKTRSAKRKRSSLMPLFFRVGNWKA